MFLNFLKVAFRNVVRHRSFSFINIAGLTLGLTACLLIGLFVRDEQQFDKFVPGGERIYRVYYQITGSEGINNIATTPPTFSTVLKNNFPEVENTLRVLNISSKVLFEAGDKKLYEEKGVFADSTFLDFFPLHFTKGTHVGALNDPGSIIISEDLAERYFGTQEAVGKELIVDKTAFQVKGVFRPEPKFHLQLNYVLPMAASGLSAEDLASWSTYGYNNYVKLKEGAKPHRLEAQFQKHIEPFIKSAESVYLPRFQKLHDIHLHSSSFKYDMALRGNSTYVQGLTMIAIFILVIACFNFVNLATAKSLQRAKEVGVRKTIGASRIQLIMQYVGETVLLTFISMVLSCIITFLLLPVLNNFTDKQIEFALIRNPIILMTLLGLTLLVGILAGFYPALVLSGFQPVKVLKGAIVPMNQGRIPWLRYGLVVIQFTLSVLLIISAIVVIRQVSFLHNKDLGFNKEQILFFPMRGETMTKNYQTFKNELEQLPGVSSVSIGYGFPGDMFGDGMMKIPRMGEERKFTQLMVDEDYIKTLGLELIAGRDFSEAMKTDRDQAYIINETAVKELGFGTPQEALGETLQWNTWRNPDLVKTGQVIGVVKDFHYKSLYDKVEPAVLHIYPEAYWKVAVKLRTAEVENTMAGLKALWTKITPDYPIEYNFLDESFTQMYKSEDKLKSLLWIFTAITIFVACLGLFGLAAYAAERRRKEIGIRKVLGATVNGVVVLLSKDFIKLVLLSLFIASPLAFLSELHSLMEVGSNYKFRETSHTDNLIKYYSGYFKGDSYTTGGNGTSTSINNNDEGVLQKIKIETIDFAIIKYTAVNPVTNDQIIIH